MVWAAAYLWYHQRVGLQPAFWAEWMPGQVLSGILDVQDGIGNGVQVVFGGVLALGLPVTHAVGGLAGHVTELPQVENQQGVGQAGQALADEA